MLTRSRQLTSVFETTIRYLGGLLSAYELSGQQHDVFIEKAQILGDKLAFAFNGVCLVPLCSVLNLKEP
jgi:mannosyl-oligosaccharide alpha-1,2-mannosidase